MTNALLWNYLFLMIKWCNKKSICPYMQGRNVPFLWEKEINLPVAINVNYGMCWEWLSWFIINMFNMSICVLFYQNHFLGHLSHFIENFLGHLSHFIEARFWGCGGGGSLPYFRFFDTLANMRFPWALSSGVWALVLRWAFRLGYVLWYSGEHWGLKYGLSYSDENKGLGYGLWYSGEFWGLGYRLWYSSVSLGLGYGL